MPKFNENFFGGFFQKHLSASALFAAASLLPGPVSAQSTDTTGWWQRAKDKVVSIDQRGLLDVYLSGYAYHGRSTYSAERISELNENVWGGGAGKTIHTPGGNLESIYFLAIYDSHYKPQIMAGYAYQWIQPIARTDIEAGAGLTALIVSRQDYFGGFPFPIVLPVASIGPDTAKVMLSYIPRLSKNKGNGDVLLAFLRFEFK
jgi:palmitoyl transferase